MKIEEQIIFKAFIHINNSYRHSMPSEHSCTISDDMSFLFNSKEDQQFEQDVALACKLMERDRIKKMLQNLCI